VLCFVIDPALRGRGIARSLLDGALHDMAARGIAAVDAFPSRVATDAATHFRGPEQLFAAAGFTTIGETERVRLMRRELP
jgi:ribosomal protein S18 acetylase RimI-like enzyme